MALPLLLAGAALLYQGISNMNSANEQAQLLGEQGLLAKKDYAYQAALALDAGYRLKQTQTMEYISAGVEIQGTPLLMLAETEKKAQAEAENLNETGQAAYDLYRKKGTITVNEGRSSLIASILNVGSLAVKK